MREGGVENTGASMLLRSDNTRPDKQVLFHNIGSSFVSWYSKELSSWYLAKRRYQVDVSLMSILIWLYFDVLKLKNLGQKVNK
jgi:hypothetical protein